MRLSLNSWNVEFSSHASQAELETRLRRSGQPFRVLDASGGYARRFYSLDLQPQFAGSESRPTIIGFHSSQTGIEPQLLLNPTASAVYVGMASSVFSFNVPVLQTKQLDLASPFYWMTRFDTLNGILVVHEVGLVWMRTDAEVIWEHKTDDIVSSITLRSAEVVEVRLIGGEGTTLSLRTGRVA